MPKKEEFNGFDDDIFSPEDFEDENETVEEESETDDKDEQVETQEEETQAVEDEEEQVKTPEETETEKQADTKADKNAYYAKLRREKEAKEKAQREKEIKEAAKLEAKLDLIKTNPYTNEAISDEEDLKIYELQKAIEEKGGDPITDLPKALAEQNRKAAQAQKALDEEKIANRKKLDAEVDELYAQYPEAFEFVKKDQSLVELHSEKDGRWTLKECYEYLIAQQKAQGIVETKVENDKKKKEIVDKVAKKNTSVPSSKSNGGKNSTGYFDMTDEEYLRQEAEGNIDFF